MAKILLFSPNVTDFFTTKLYTNLISQREIERVDVGGWARNDDIEIKYPVLGKVVSKKYFSRIGCYLKTLVVLPFLLRKYDVVYSYAIDTALIVYLASKLSFNRNLKFIYGYSDVHSICTSKGLIATIARKIESFLGARACLTIFTSECFLKNYFGEVLKSKVKRYIIIENKIQPSVAEKMRIGFKRQEGREEICFGYVGILSYPQVYDFLIKASSNGIKIKLHGNLTLQQKNTPSNIEYCGKYKNPDDIGGIFSAIDLSLVLLDFKECTNTQWQMTNRFYDALLMETPIVIQKGTAHADFVEKYRVGMVIDLRYPDDAICKLKSITQKDISMWRDNIKMLNSNIYLLSDEYDKLTKIFLE